MTFQDSDQVFVNWLSTDAFFFFFICSITVASYCSKETFRIVSCYTDKLKGPNGRDMIINSIDIIKNYKYKSKINTMNEYQYINFSTISCPRFVAIHIIIIQPLNDIHAHDFHDRHHYKRGLPIIDP